MLNQRTQRIIIRLWKHGYDLDYIARTYDCTRDEVDATILTYKQNKQANMVRDHNNYPEFLEPLL